MNLTDKYVKYFMEQSEQSTDKTTKHTCDAHTPVSSLKAVVDRVQSMMMNTNTAADKVIVQKRKRRQTGSTSKKPKSAWQLVKRFKKDG